MALHFAESEYADRRLRVVAELRRRGLAGLLVFRQDSMYYLTGYDTAGFAFFQCLFLGADGRLILVTRLPDLMQARRTSVIEDIRIWTDRDQSNPLRDLQDVLKEEGCHGETLGVELDAFGLTGLWHQRLTLALTGFCGLTDVSDLVARQRAVKSPAEIVYVRKAAALADEALEEANRLAVSGAFEGDILAAMQSLFFKADGDHPAMEFIIGSGRDALLCRYFSGRRHLESQDQMTLEFARLLQALPRRTHANHSHREGEVVNSAGCTLLAERRSLPVRKVWCRVGASAPSSTSTQGSWMKPDTVNVV